MKVIQIAKEIGIGFNSVVEFLQTKGYEIKAKPAALVSEEMRKALFKEFYSSYKIKSKADRMIMGNGTNPQMKKNKRTLLNKNESVSTFQKNHQLTI